MQPQGFLGWGEPGVHTLQAPDEVARATRPPSPNVLSPLGRRVLVIRSRGIGLAPT